MYRTTLLAAAGCAALVFSATAAAQFVPPPGSALGTESGTYGSSIGTDVRGTGSVDRFGRAYDPMNPTDAGSLAAERERRERMNRRTPPEDKDNVAVPNANAPGANMNPGLSPAYGARESQSVSPNLNPGLAPGAAPGAAPGNAPGTAGTATGRGGPATGR
jgi:hypothetical protein